MIFKKNLVYKALPFLIFNSPGSSQELVPHKIILSLSLQSSMDIAEKNSTDVKLTKQDLQNYDSLQTLSYFNLGPTIKGTADTTWYPQNNPNIDVGQPNQITTASVTITQPLTGIWQNAYKISQLSSQSGAAAIDLTVKKIKARTEGAQAFINAQQAYNDMETKRADLENTNQQFNDTKILFESGDENKTKIDLLQMQAKVATAEREFETSKNEFQNKIAELKTTLKIEEDISINLSQENSSNWEKQDNKMPELSSLLSQGTKNRGELKSFDKKIEAQNSAIKQGNFEYFPKINAFSTYSRTDNYGSNDIYITQAPDSLNFGLKLEWNIWDGGISAENRMNKINEREKLKINKDKTMFDITKEVTTAYNSLKLNINVLPQAKLAAEILEEAFKLSQVKYKTGNLTANELIVTQNTYINSKIALTKLRGDIDNAWIQLQAALGNLPIASLKR
jgi:outer membrane protein